MPEVVEWAAAAIAEGIGNLLVAAGVPVAVAVDVANIAFYAAETVTYVGAAIALQPQLPHPDVGKFNIRQTIAPRRDGYGRARLSGVFLLWESKINFYDVLYLCQGPIDGFENTYFNDDLISVNATTHQVEDTFLDHRYIRSGVGPWVLLNRGLATETSFADLGITFGAETFASLGSDVWGTNHRADGCASMAVIGRPVEEKDLAGYMPNGTPTETVSARLKRVYDWRDGTQSAANPSTWKWSDNPVLAYVHYECWHEHGNQSDFNTRIVPSLAAWTTAANACDDAINVVNASSSLTAKVAKGGTSVQLADVTGITTGTKLYLGDPGEVVTVSGPPSGLTVSFSPALSFPHNPGAPAAWPVAAGTVFEKRYRLGFMFNYDNPPDAVRKTILESFDGWVGEAGDGSLTCYAGKYAAPTVTFDHNDGHILAFSYYKFQPDEDAVNQFNISYTSIANQYSEVECDPWQDPVDIASRGVIRPQPLKLLQVQSLSQARRLAKRKMSRISYGANGKVTLDLYGLNGLGQRFINLNIPDIASLTNVVIEVIKPPEFDVLNGTVTFTFAVVDPNMDAWNAATEEGASPVAPNTAVVNSLSGPTISSVTPFFDSTGAGGSGVRLHVQLPDPGRSDYSYSVRWRVTGDTNWTLHSYTGVVGDGVHVTLDTGFVAGGVNIDVQAEYLTAGGGTGWSATTVVFTNLVGATPPPVAYAALLSAANQVCRKPDFEDGQLGSWSAGTIGLGVGGPGFTNSLQLAGGQISQEGAIDRPITPSAKYLVQCWARWIGAGSSNNKVGLKTTTISGGSPTLATVNLFTLGGGLSGTWKFFSAQVSTGSDQVLGAPYIENTASGGEEFALVSITPASSTLNLANNAVTNSGAVVQSGSIPASGMSKPGGTVTGSGFTASGTTGSGYKYDGTHFSNFVQLAEAIFTVPERDGTGIGGDVDVFFETGTDFPNGVTGTMYMTLDYSFTATATNPSTAFFKSRLFDQEPSGGARVQGSYTLFDTLQGLAVGTHKVTVWFYMNTLGTPATDSFVDPMVSVTNRAK